MSGCVRPARISGSIPASPFSCDRAEDRALAHVGRRILVQGRQDRGRGIGVTTLGHPEQRFSSDAGGCVGGGEALERRPGGRLGVHRDRAERRVGDPALAFRLGVDQRAEQAYALGRATFSSQCTGRPPASSSQSSEKVRMRSICRPTTRNRTTMRSAPSSLTGPCGLLLGAAGARAPASVLRRLDPARSAAGYLAGESSSQRCSSCRSRSTSSTSSGRGP